MRYTLKSMLYVFAILFGIAAYAEDQSLEPTNIRDTEPRPLAPADDPVNKYVQKSTVDGLVVVVTIDGTVVTLDSATPARIPRAARPRTNQSPVPDTVTATGFSGGAKISVVQVPDQVVNTQEGVGIVRVTKRQLSFSLVAPRALDTVEILAPATGAKAQLDVRPAYANLCRGDKPNPQYCPPGAPVGRN
jgi:hypothetical protein